MPTANIPAIVIPDATRDLLCKKFLFLSITVKAINTKKGMQSRESRYCIRSTGSGLKESCCKKVKGSTLSNINFKSGV